MYTIYSRATCWIWTCVHRVKTTPKPGNTSWTLEGNKQILGPQTLLAWGTMFFWGAGDWGCLGVEKLDLWVWGPGLQASAVATVHVGQMCSAPMDVAYAMKLGCPSKNGHWLRVTGTGLLIRMYQVYFVCTFIYIYIFVYYTHTYTIYLSTDTIYIYHIHIPYTYTIYIYHIHIPYTYTIYIYIYHIH